MSCGNGYPCGTNPYGNMSALPYGYQGKNTLVKITLGIEHGSDPIIKGPGFFDKNNAVPTPLANNQLGGVSVLSVNLRGYGNINYGSTAGAGNAAMWSANTTAVTGTGFPEDIAAGQGLLTTRANGVPLYIREQALNSNATFPDDFNFPTKFAQKGQKCDGLCLQIPCGVNSFEIVTMVWNMPPAQGNEDGTDPGDRGLLNSPYSAAYSAWVAVWHVDLAKCSVTAVSWARVLSEDPAESCGDFDHSSQQYITTSTNSGTKYMNATLSKCCCSCTSNCCTKVTCPSDLDATACDSDCTNVIKLFSQSCGGCCTNTGCC